MTINEARNIQNEFQENQNPTEEEVLFIMMKVWIDERKCN